MGEQLCKEIEKSIFETKYVVCIVFNRDKLAHLKPLIEKLKTFKLYINRKSNPVKKDLIMDNLKTSHGHAFT